MLNSSASGSDSTKWTREDADAGNADAQFGMGVLCALRPATPDYAEAVAWYQKAADQNHALAQFNLGQMYAQGQGVQKSDAVAVMWMRRAGAGGDAGAQYNLANRYAHASMLGSEMDAVESHIEAYKWFALAAAQEYRDAGLQCDRAAMRMSRDEVVEARDRMTRPSFGAQ